MPFAREDFDSNCAVLPSATKASKGTESGCYLRQHVWGAHLERVAGLQLQLRVRSDTN